MRLAIFALLVLLPGCESTWPGTPVGSYHVTATLASNGCGAALTSPATLDFDVELRRDGSFAYWRRPGMGLMGGGYDTTGAFQFTSSNTVASYGGGDGGTPTCVVYETETIHGTSVIDEDDEGGVIDAGNALDGGVLQALSGADDIDIAPGVGTNCGGLLAVNGGTFAALPCHVQYVLTGAVAAPLR